MENSADLEELHSMESVELHSAGSAESVGASVRAALPAGGVLLLEEQPKESAPTGGCS